MSISLACQALKLQDPKSFSLEKAQNLLIISQNTRCSKNQRIYEVLETSRENLEKSVLVTREATDGCHIGKHVAKSNRWINNGKSKAKDIKTVTIQQKGTTVNRK